MFIDIKVLIKQKLGILAQGGAGIYLGLPECFSGSKVKMLDYIKERMKGRMTGWYGRLISQGGKEILLKSVALAMPVHAMMCFKLPKSTCENISSAMADYWWNSAENKRKTHWISWKKMCIPKDQGGLGFRDIHLFNQALLAKQAWRILQVPDCLFARFLKSRYFPYVEFLHAEMGARPSFAWRSILHGRDLLKKGLSQMVGNGKSLRVWSSPWLKDVTMRAPLMRNILVDLDLRVSDLIDATSKWWDRDKLRELFYPRDAQLVLKINPVLEVEDFCVWDHNKGGEYSVKSGYWLATQIFKDEELREANMQPSLNGMKNQIWNIKAPNKIKTFLWKVLSDAITVADNILRRGMKIDERCQVCGLVGESSNHVLFYCTLARQVWALSLFPSPDGGFHRESVYQNISYVLGIGLSVVVPIMVRRSFPWILWMLWKNRNNFIFEGMSFHALDLVDKILNDVNQWFQAQARERQAPVVH